VLSVGRGGQSLGEPTKHVRTHTHKLKPLNHFTVVPQPLSPLRFNRVALGGAGPSYGRFAEVHLHQHQPSNNSARNSAHMKVSNRATQTALRDTRTTEHPPTSTGSSWSAYPQKKRCSSFSPYPLHRPRSVQGPQPHRSTAPRRQPAIPSTYALRQSTKANGNGRDRSSSHALGDHTTPHSNNQNENALSGL